MKPRLLVSSLLALFLVFGAAGSVWAATATVSPNQFPNGATDSPTNNVIHTRFDITMSGTLATGTGSDITITLPSGLTFKTTNSPAAFVTWSNRAAGTLVVSLGTTTTTRLDFDISAPATVTLNAGHKVTVEADITTPSSFTSTGAFNVGIGFPNSTADSTNVSVTLKNNQQITFVTFSEPAANNDTTSAEGTGFKITFPASLPDLVHDDNTKSAANNPNGSDSQTQTGTLTSNGTDDFDDMQYQFWVSTDSTLTRSALGGTPINILEMKRVPTVITNATLSSTLDRDNGTSGVDYDPTPSGLYQNPTAVNASLITELFTTRFADSNLEGLVDTRGLQEGRYFIYISSNKTSDYFLGRSGSLVVKHKPGFLGAAWDKNATGGTAFSTNGYVETTVDAVSAYDAANLTLDSGNLFDQDGTQSTNEATPAGTVKDNVNLVFRAVDYDDPTARVWIFVSTNSGLDTTSLTTSGAYPSRVITGLTGARLVSQSDTLVVGARSHNLKPENLISVSGTDSIAMAAGSYTVYFAATDGKSLTLEKASDVSAALSKTALTLSVKHSPNISPDATQFDDGGGNNRLPVNTGVSIATAKPQRYVRISWEQAGLNGDKDVDDNATIDLYYSSTSTFTTAAGLLADIGVGDTHKINRTATIQENDNTYDRFGNHYDWDVWNYVSAEGTIPTANTDYYIYGVTTGGSTSRLRRFDSSGSTRAVRFTHDSYVSPLLPAKNLAVGPNDPITFQWTAVDVDNAAPAAGPTGTVASNGTTTSPDILVFLSTYDFGATTTYGGGGGTLSNPPAGQFVYVANSRDGDDTTPGTTSGIIRMKEGVDTSFVFVANKMRVTVNGLSRVMPGSPSVYYAYMLINNNAANVATAPYATSTDIAYRLPGQVTLTGNGGSDPTTARFVFPTQLSVTSGEILRIPIVADDGALTVGQANIYVSVDTTYFEPIDKNASTAGTQPYTLGSNTALSSSKVIGNQATRSGANWICDFTYLDQSTGFTFLDGFETIAYLNLRVRQVTNTANVFITLDNNPATGRQSALYRDLTTGGGANMNASVPGGSAVRIDPLGSISGTVPLQGRANMTMAASDVAFFLRLGSMRGPNGTGSVNQAGGFDSLSDSTFVATNDTDNSRAGIQKALAADGSFSLTKVPAGDYTLVVYVDRYLAGQREVTVKAGEAVAGIQPTLDGRGIDRSQLLAGDAAGYNHDGLSNTVSRPNNFIDSDDKNAIQTAFFTIPSDALYNTYADVDGSLRVDGVDLLYAVANATTLSPSPSATTAIEPVRPTFGPKPARPQGSKADAVFLLATEQSAVRASETFDVTVQVKGAVAARAYEFHLAYDMTRMEPLGAVNGDLLSQYAVDMAQRDAGGLFAVAGVASDNSAAVSGDGSLATVRFRALKGGPVDIAIEGGFLIDAQLNKITPKMDSKVALDVASGPLKLHDASGAEVLGLIVPDGHSKVDFNDFFALAEAFGKKSGETNFNPLADLNADDAVDFNDFFIFADNFGKTVVDAPAARRSAKPVGANVDGTISLAALGGAVKPGQTVTVEASLSGAAVRGVGFDVTYDPARFEFVEAARSGEELFLARPDGEGRIAVARAVEGSLDNAVARLVFRVKGEFETPGRFQIADGLILGADGLVAQIAGGTLDLATTPSKFALIQNFPNPFNPETTIKYNLADEAQVHLRVYNIVGQVVRTLVQDRQAAGRYSVRWDGRDERGLTVSSGVYFYQITAGNFKDVRKLMLLK